MKKICALLLLFITVFSFTACHASVPEEPTITVGEDGYLVVNGNRTEYRIHTSDEITVSDDGYVTVNGVKTEYLVDVADVITVQDGYLVVNGVKTAYRVWDDVEEEGSENRYIHLSFDDVSLCFQNLSNAEYTSLFDEPFFARLKQLHDEYGARFSLYTYNSVLNAAPATYADEFASNSDWLKLGFHSSSSGASLAGATYDQGLAYWNAFVANVERICGTTDCLDRMPRLEYFSGSPEALLGMRDADFGALGFLAADDNRLSYYFDDSIMTYLYDNDHVKDETNNLLFLSTDLRADWFYSFTTNNIYKKPLKGTAADELEYRKNSTAFESGFKSLIVFSHEWLVYNGNTVNSKFNTVTETCEFAKRNGIAFDYAQNRSYASTDGDALFDGVASE